MSLISAMNRRCLETASRNWTEGNGECSATIDLAIDVSGGTFSYDASIFGQDWDNTSHEDDVKNYIMESNKKQELYQAIHMGNSPRNPVFMWHSSAAAKAYQYEAMADWSVWYDLVAESKNVSILIYSGEFDMLDGPLTQEPWLKALKTLAGDNQAMWSKPRKIYYVHDDVANQDIVGGYYRTDDTYKFTFLTVPKTGHFVPIAQLLTTKTFLKDIITKGSLQCHKQTEAECETGAIMCGYMNSCSKQGTCSSTTGKCACNSGFTGADCSDTLINLPQAGNFQQSYQVQGVNWLYFTFSQTAVMPFSFSLSSQN
jgi:hypothetical protein